MNRIRLPLPRSYWISLSVVSLVFFAAQLYLNPFMTQDFWGVYLEREVYQAEVGVYRTRIDASFSTPDREAAFIVENSLRIETAKTLTARIPVDRVEPPWTLSFTIKKEDRIVEMPWFEVWFAEGDAGEYLLKLAPFATGGFGGGPGIYLVREGERERVASLSAEVLEIGAASRMELRLDHDGRGLNLTINGRRAAHLPTVESLSRPRIRFVTHPTNFVLVDDVRLECAGAGGERSVVFEEDFDLIPIAVDLSSLAWCDTDSIPFRTIHLLALLLAGILYDLLFFRVFGSWGSRQKAGLLLAGLNGQVTLLLILRAIFSLPYGPTVFGILVFILAKSLMLFRTEEAGGVVADTGGRLKGPGARHLAWINGSILLLICLHLFANPSTHDRLVWHGAYSIGFLGLFGISLLSFPSLNRLALVCLLQYAGFFLLGLFYPFMEADTYSILVFLSIGLAMIAGIRERRPARPLRAGLLILGLWVLLLAGAELTLRTTSLDRLLDFDRRVENLFWELEKHTALFGPKAARDTFEDNVGREHPRAKGPGVFRVICLGSSTTVGDGQCNAIMHSYPVQLEKRLREQDVPHAEVLNQGVSGYGFYQLMVYFNELLLPLDPDLVVLYFGSNADYPFHPAYYERARRVVEGAPYVRSQKELEAALGLRWNPEWLVRAFLTLSRSRLFMGANCLVKGVSRLRIPDSEAYKPRNDYGDILDEWLKACERSGVQVLLVPELLSYTPPHSRDLFRDACKRHRSGGVHYLDGVERFGGPGRANEYFIDHVHMNERGYDLLAEEIARFIRRNNLID